MFRIAQNTTLQTRASPTPTSLFLFGAAAVITALGPLLELPRFDATFTRARVFFSDPDDYMRAYRARKILTGDAMRIRFMPEINAPRGAELHWTAPMDYLLVAAATVFGPFVRHPDAFGATAAWTPVILGAVYIACLIGFVRRGFGWIPALLAGLIVALSPGYHRAFQLGHADHQCLLELLFLLAIGPWIPRVRSDGSPGLPSLGAGLVSGIAAGLAIWVASIALLVWAALLVGVTTSCLWGPPQTRRQYSQCRLAWSAATAMVVIAGFLIENWPDLSVMTADKISLIHVALMGIAFVLPGWRRREPKPGTSADGDAPLTTSPDQSQTTFIILSLLAVTAFILWVKFNTSHVFEYLDRPEFRRWSEQIQELKPLYAKTGQSLSFQRLHERLGYVPYALPFLWMFFVWSPRVPRCLKITLGLLAPALLLLTIGQRRWLDHYNMAVVPVMVIGACEAMRELSRRTIQLLPTTQFLIVGLVLVALCFPFAQRTLSRRSGDFRLDLAWFERSDFVADQIDQYEANHPEIKTGPRTILCSDDDGSVLLYYTNKPVVATVYHRALDGILEASRFFAQRIASDAREQLDRLGVRYVVVPPMAGEQLAMFERIAFGKPPSFEASVESINEVGDLVHALRPKPEQIAQTMAYRLVFERYAIPGVERIAEIDEGQGKRGQATGLLYVVHER